MNIPDVIKYGHRTVLKARQRHHGTRGFLRDGCRRRFHLDTRHVTVLAELGRGVQCREQLVHLGP